MTERASIARLARLFFQVARPYFGRIVFTLLVIVIAAGAKTLQGYLVKPVIDDLPKAQDWTGLRLIALVAVGLSAVMFIFGVLRDYLTNYVNKRITSDIRNRLVDHMTHLPLRNYYDRKSGDLVSRITNDINALEPASNFFFDSMLTEPVMFLCAIGMIFYTNWKLALIAVVLFPIYLIPLVKLGKAMRKARKQSLESMGDMTSAMIETLGGIKVVKSFNMEREQVRQFQDHNEAFFRRIMRAIWKRSLGENMAQLFVGMSIAGMLAGGGFLLLRGMMTAGDLAAFGLGVAMINSSVREMTKSYNHLLEGSVACDRLFEVLQIPREEHHDEGEDLAGTGEGVEFKGVSFAYNTELVLRDVDLRVASGEVVALVGRSGAGKTTLCDLLCRFYDPTSGVITLGGKDLRKLRRSSLLRHVAVVAQDTFLFNATIGENIRYGRPDMDAKAVEAASRAANIHDFIASLPNGYETIVGERGAKLSGGQRQRVAIARAVLKDPDILILDEATSALDSENEKLVQQALAALIRGGKRRITLVIAHRLSTVKDADRIVVLEDGRVVEIGRHDELVAKNGAYAGLYKLQFAEAGA